MAQFQRTGKAIKLNHSGALPRYVISIAVDSVERKETLDSTSTDIYFANVSCVSARLVGTKMVARKAINTTDPEAMWKWIDSHTKSNQTTWLVGEGILAQLILCGLPDRFTRSEINIDKPRSKRSRIDQNGNEIPPQALAVLENPPTIIGCRVAATQGRLVIVDILNWFPQGILAGAAAEEFTLSDDDVAFPSDGSRIGSSQKRASDAHKAFTCLIRWVKDNDMGLFRYTASAQSMGAFRHRFMPHKIYVHDNQAIQKLERLSYFGGRSEMFKYGDINEQVYQLDVNALFPSVMQHGWFPKILKRYEERAEILGLLPSIDWSASVADVEITTSVPAFPLRTSLNIIYPVGRFRTVLAGEELEFAFRKGCITGCASWAEYGLEQLFTKFVTELWAMRQEYKEAGNVLYEQFAKRIMNSLYGKFAQLTPSWLNVPNDYSMLPFTTESRLTHATNEWTQFRSIGWQVQKLTERTEKEGSFYAISAFVTAAARRRMDRIRNVAGKKRVLYQGVDSVITNGEGKRNLLNAGEIVPGRLGKLREEHSAGSGTIRGISDYELGDKIVLSSRCLNHEKNALGDITQHRTYIMQHLFRNGPIDHIERKAEEWQRRSKYQKGDIQPDGWVEPLALGAEPNSSSSGSKPELAADCISSTAIG